MRQPRKWTPTYVAARFFGSTPAHVIALCKAGRIPEKCWLTGPGKRPRYYFRGAAFKAWWRGEGDEMEGVPPPARERAKRYVKKINDSPPRGRGLRAGQIWPATPSSTGAARASGPPHPPNAREA